MLSLITTFVVNSCNDDENDVHAARPKESFGLSQLPRSIYICVCIVRTNVFRCKLVTLSTSRLLFFAVLYISKAAALAEAEPEPA
jgi:hypothetical protein